MTLTYMTLYFYYPVMHITVSEKHRKLDIWVGLLCQSWSDLSYLIVPISGVLIPDKLCNMSYKGPYGTQILKSKYSVRDSLWDLMLIFSYNKWKIFHREHKFSNKFIWYTWMKPSQPRINMVKTWVIGHLNNLRMMTWTHA